MTPVVKDSTFCQSTTALSRLGRGWAEREIMTSGVGPLINNPYPPWHNLPQWQVIIRTVPLWTWICNVPGQTQLAQTIDSVGFGRCGLLCGL